MYVLGSKISPLTLLTIQQMSAVSNNALAQQMKGKAKVCNLLPHVSSNINETWAPPLPPTGRNTLGMYKEHFVLFEAKNKVFEQSAMPHYYLFLTLKY